jgi:hypothetical protein
LKARVTEPKHEFYGCEFEVAYLSYENTAGKDLKTKDIIAAGFDEVDFIFDANWEEEIVRNREILNIKKPKKASYYMYYALIKSIEGHIGLCIKDLLILDDNELDSKKVWIKKIIAAANNKPLVINITGQNYSNKFDIKLSYMDNQEFIKECGEEIDRLQIGLKKYRKRINGLMNTVKSIKDEKVYTSTQELSLKGA